MGCLLIIGGIVAIAYSYGNSYIILLGIILIICGGCSLNNEGKKKPGTKGKTGGGSSDDGYEGTTHTGSGRPTAVHRSDGTDVDTSGYGWRDSVGGGRENVFTGEETGTDIFGNWTYTDSDGESDDGASFD